MKYFALLIFILITTSTGAKIDDPIDHSKPELVKRYLTMSCDLLAHSFRFQNKELLHLSKRLDSCYDANEKYPEYAYGPVMCLYVKMQRQLMADHRYSVEKAFNLMCNDNGYRKNPEHDIDF